MDDLLEVLEGRGLTAMEARKFLALLHTLEFPKRLVREFHENCDAGFPDGPTIEEALISLKAEFQEDYFRPEDMEPLGHDWDAYEPDEEQLEDPELTRLMREHEDKEDVDSFPSTL